MGKAGKFIIIFLSSLYISSFAKLEITATTKSYGGRFAPKSCTVIWIQTPSGEFIRTVGLWARNYIRHLNTWERISNGDVDGLSGASRRSHGTINATWDLTGQDDKPVPDGTYEFWIECTEDNGTGRYTSGTIEVNNTSKTVEGATTSVFTKFEAQYIAPVALSVVSPNGGEKLEQNSQVVITWQDRITENVKIELLNNGNTVSTIASSTESDGEYEWIIPGDQATGSNYSIRIQSVSNSSITAESKDKFSIEKEFFITQFPYMVDFDNLDTGGTILFDRWSQFANDDLDWLVLSGPTPSKIGNSPNVTGPDGDHTSGNGKYIYIEASGSNSPNKKADFILPKINTKDADLELVFWCHMFSDSNHMGNLYLDIEVDGQWKNEVLHLKDNHGDEWFKVNQSLVPFKGERVRLKFRGITGKSWASDICIDDLQIQTSTGVSHRHAQSKSITTPYYSNNRLHITIPSTAHGKNQSAQLKLYSVQGKEVVDYTLHDIPAHGVYTVSMDDLYQTNRLSKGLYVCKLIINKDAMVSTIIIE